MTNRVAVALRIAVLVTSALSFAQTQNAMPILAVLEDTAGDTPEAPHHRGVRVAFVRSHEGWTAFDSQCSEFRCLQPTEPTLKQDMVWTVAFNGRALGAARTHFDEKHDEQMDWGQFRVTSTPVPSIGKPVQEFAGWMGLPVSRPLVLNSRPFIDDPETWKPSQVSDHYLSMLRLEFKRKYAMLTDCETSESAKQYADNDIKVVKSYASKRKWQLVQLAAEGCAVDDERGDPLTMEWYIVTSDGQVRYLDSNMHLVNAGDYDNDGRSELVFSIDDYNRGGYKLFYDDFKQKAVFEFSYH